MLGGQNLAENYFKQLNAIDMSKKVKEKNNLSYLSWAAAWSEIKKIHPTATYKVYENEEGWNYFTDGRTCWVKTGVTINDIEHIESLPVMSYKNQSIPLESVTSMDVNKAIQRSITKACARHGLGLYIYEGMEESEEMATIKGLQQECFGYITKKNALSEKAKAEVTKICNEYNFSTLKELKEIEDEELLSELRKKLLAVRK